MLVGLNVAASFFAGSVLAWGIIGPALVHNGAAFGVSASDDPRYKDYVSFFSLSPAASNKDHPSPRYWMLWPGVLLMIVTSFVELILQYKVIGAGFRAVWRATAKFTADMSARAGKPSPFLEKQGNQREENLIEDPAPPHEQIPVLWWGSGLVVAIFMICVVLGVVFHLPVGMSILSLFLAFFFSFLAVQCTGATGMTLKDLH